MERADNKQDNLEEEQLARLNAPGSRSCYVITETGVGARTDRPEESRSRSPHTDSHMSGQVIVMQVVLQSCEESVSFFSETVLC